MKAVLYARVSTEEQAENYSIPTQLEAIRKYASDNDMEIVKEFIDAGVSGSVLDRPALRELRELVSIGTKVPMAVIAYDPDRLSRNFVQLMVLANELEEAGVQLAFVTQTVGNTPEERMLFGMKGLFAEYERTKILERTKRGLLARVKSGKLPSGRRGRLYGYTYQDGKRYINEGETETVKDIFNWLEEGLTINAITYKLRALDIPTPSGKGFWIRSTVYRILTNISYTGRTYELGIEIRGVTPPIVASELFDRVQVRLAQNKSKSGRRGKIQYLLRGLISCARCGRKYWGYAHSITKERRYYCMGRRAIITPHKCDNIGYKADYLEGLVWQRVEEVLARPETVLVGLEAQREELEKVSYTEKEIETVKYQLINRETQRGRIHKTFYITGNEGQFRHDIAELDAEVKVLQERLNHLLDVLKAREEIDVSIEGIKKACTIVKDNLKTLSFGNKRRALEALELRLFIDGDNISIQGAVPIGDIPSTLSCSRR